MDNQQLVLMSNIYEGPMQSMNRMFRRTKLKSQTFAYKFLQISPYFDSTANNLKFRMIDSPCYVIELSVYPHELTFIVLINETDPNYQEEFDKYNEILELVYEDSSYNLISILYKDLKYLVPTQGGLLSVFKLALIPVMICFRKQHWVFIVNQMAKLMSKK